MKLDERLKSAKKKKTSMTLRIPDDLNKWIREVSTIYEISITEVILESIRIAKEEMEKKQ